MPPFRLFLVLNMANLNFERLASSANKTNIFTNCLLLDNFVFEQNFVLDINPDMVGDTDTFIVVLSDVTLGSIGTRNEALISVV